MAKKWKVPAIIKALLALERGIAFLQRQQLEQRLHRAQDKLKVKIRHYEHDAMEEAQHGQTKPASDVPPVEGRPEGQ